MSTTHHMKMAKASQADIDTAIQLHQFLRAMSQGRSAPEVVDEFGYKGYDDLLERQAADVEFALRAERAEQPKPIEPAPCACCDKPASHIGSDGHQRCSEHTLKGDQPTGGA